MDIGILVYNDKDKSYDFTKEVCEYLKSKEVNVYTEDSIGYIGYKSLSIDEMFYRCEFVIIIGGDGTILNKIKETNTYNAKIYGINLGHLGYLTDVDRDKYKKGIDKLLKGKYFCENRMMLECIIGDFKYTALNDICINRGVFSSMIELDIDINNSHVDTIRCDGVIVTTPTGSTAYNLSVGGPIIKSDTEIIGVTPIAPHSIFARPFIVSGDDTISVVVKPLRNEAYLVVDGKKCTLLEKDEKITIRKYSEKVTIVKTVEKNFYKVLRDKIQK
ncbi:MAG: NAD(+)/NADH kinase [Lachnospirales bacterium]